MNGHHYTKIKNLSTYIVLLSFILFTHLAVSQNESKKYFSVLDSAEAYVYINPDKALALLNTIPNPIDKYIEEKQGDYYSLLAACYYEKHELTKSYQNQLLAINAFENKGNLTETAKTCIEIYLLLFLSERVEEANNYKLKAKRLFEETNNEYGLLEIQQLEAYAEFANKNYAKSNDLLIQDLHMYKNVEKKFHYLLALYMIASNYTYLDDLEASHIYYSRFKMLKNAEDVFEDEYIFYNAVLQLDYAKYHLKINQLDSVKNYLLQAKQAHGYFNDTAKQDYYKINIGLYGAIGNEKMRQTYTDSLNDFKNEMLNSNISASYAISESLKETRESLDITAKKKRANFILAMVLLIVFLICSAIIYRNFTAIKYKLGTFETSLSEFNYLKRNQQKLGAKVNGLEEYIDSLKSEIKDISKISNVELQKKRIRELFKTMQLNSSNIIKNGDSHLQIINELNVEFFKKLNDVHPNLESSTQMICYYVYMGFKNKEIAFFLNLSVRSIEGRRYRINKKINENNLSTTLLEYLNTLMQPVN